MFVDSDDYIDANMLYEINEVIKKDSFPDLINFSYYEINNNKKEKIPGLNINNITRARYFCQIY